MSKLGFMNWRYYMDKLQAATVGFRYREDEEGNLRISFWGNYEDWELSIEPLDENMEPIEELSDDG